MFRRLVRPASQGADLTVFPTSSRSSCGGLQAEPSATADGTPQRTLLKLRALDSARISATAVSAPVGRFLLVRQGTAVGAVRFTRFHRDADRKLAGVLLSGGEHTHAEYDWYFQGDGSGDFTKPNVTYGRGKVRDTPTLRIGRFAFKPFAALHVRCGPLVARWQYPTALVFNFTVEASGFRTEATLALAPTQAAYIRDVHLKKMRLTWYRLDPTRTDPLFIPLEQFP